MKQRHSESVLQLYSPVITLTSLVFHCSSQIQQTVVTPKMENVAMENAAITQAPVKQVQQPVIKATLSGKSGHSALGLESGF